MRYFRRISLSVHALTELVAGLALIIASLALDLGTAGLLGVFGAGVLLTGLGLGALENLPLAAHQTLDRWMTTALAALSIVLAFQGDALAALLLLAVAAGQLALTGMTRWTRPALRH